MNTQPNLIPPTEPAAKDLLRLLEDAEKLLFAIARTGGYGSLEADSMRRLLSQARSKCQIGEKSVSDNGQVSINVIRNLIGGGTPKLHNFLSILHGLRESTLYQLAERGLAFEIGENGYNVLIRHRMLTNAGQLLQLESNLEDLTLLLRGHNSPTEILTDEVRLQLVELLEHLLAQLRGKATALNSLTAVKTRLKRLVSGLGNEVESQATKNAASGIVKAIIDVLF